MSSASIDARNDTQTQNVNKSDLIIIIPYENFSAGIVERKLQGTKNVLCDILYFLFSILK